MKKWYDKGTLVAFACFIFPPLGIYALWKSSAIEKNGKIIFTLVALVWMGFMVSSGKNEKTVSATTVQNATTSLYATKEDSIKAYNEALKSVESSNSLKAKLSQIENLRSEFSGLGIGELGSWNRPDENSDYMSITNYYEFGNQNDNLRQNNIALYLTSENPSQVEKIELGLNVNNKKEESQAVAFFKEKSVEVLKVLGLKYSDKKQIVDGYQILIIKEKGNVNKYTLTIEKV